MDNILRIEFGKIQKVIVDADRWESVIKETYLRYGVVCNDCRIY